MAKEKSELVRQVQQYKNDINKYSGISGNIEKVIADANLKLKAKEKQILALKMELGAKDLENSALSNRMDSLEENYQVTLT